MTLIDTYSKRLKRQSGMPPDPYRYDEIPRELRVQIIHISREVAPRQYDGSESYAIHRRVVNHLKQEYGTFRLAPGNSEDEELEAFILSEARTERVLDAVELYFRICFNMSRHQDYAHHFEKSRPFLDGVEELNERFKEHAIGYQFVGGEIVRMDSQYVHSEIVLPALHLLAAAEFQGATQEFLSAHEHYRHGRLKECIVDCLKSFESTMRAICERNGWQVKDPATAKSLIAACLENGLVPSFEEAQMNALRSLLESGVPTLRNRLGGHGQGATVTPAPEYLTRYALNLTASAVLMIAEAAQRHTT